MLKLQGFLQLEEMEACHSAPRLDDNVKGHFGVDYVQRRQVCASYVEVNWIDYVIISSELFRLEEVHLRFALGDGCSSEMLTLKSVPPASNRLSSCRFITRSSEACLTLLEICQ